MQNVLTFSALALIMELSSGELFRNLIMLLWCHLRAFMSLYSEEWSVRCDKGLCHWTATAESDTRPHGCGRLFFVILVTRGINASKQTHDFLMQPVQILLLHPPPAQAGSFGTTKWPNKYKYQQTAFDQHVQQQTNGSVPNIMAWCICVYYYATEKPI